jgi:hypothetical protein
MPADADGFRDAGGEATRSTSDAESLVLTIDLTADASNFAVLIAVSPGT